MWGLFDGKVINFIERKNAIIFYREILLKYIYAVENEEIVNF
jgi:hypothetical protein